MAAVEVAAARRFHFIGMPDIAEGEPTDAAAVLERIDAGHAYVATDETGACVGFAFYRLLDARRLYLEELDVAPSHAGQRIGARLIERIMMRAARDGFAEVVLSTFRDVPWNAPYYARVGSCDRRRSARRRAARDSRASRRARARRDAPRVHARRRARVNVCAVRLRRRAPDSRCSPSRLARRTSRHRLVQRCAEFETARQVRVRDEQLAPRDRVGAAVGERLPRRVGRELLVRDQRAAERFLQARAQLVARIDSRVKMNAILRRPSSRAT
jgi:GNAT superfamily N-acetyltransferase